MSEGAESAAAPDAGTAPDPMKSERAWAVPAAVKGLFFWGALSMLSGLIGYKVYERVRYEAILIESIMDAVPMDEAAPDFSLSDGDNGAKVHLASLRGRYVFVNFWATWCPPCREEMPSMEYLARKVGKDMVFLAVTVDEDWNEVRRFFGADKPSFRVLWDPKREVTRRYGTEKFPESYLVNPNGRMVAKFVGPRDWNTQASEEYFRRLLTL
jgi:thiol-disulfide isomerase/thioredoxin